MHSLPSTKVQSYAGQWNVQVVRGKVTTRCLWNACRALGIGLALLLLGTTMAVIGYYAEQLSEGDETRGNSTVHVRYETRGFHLNNLSYAGPIVMGIGGFIVVAACVMTFEARDSAAKVVPARLKPSTAPSSARSTPRDTRPSRRERRAASCQTRESVRAHSSRRIGEVVSRSPSAPSLVDGRSSHSSKLSPSGEYSLLSPHLLPRQAISMDCSHVSEQMLDFNTNIRYVPKDTLVLDLQQWRTIVSVQNEVKKKRLLKQKTVDAEADLKKNRKSLGAPILRRSASTSTQTRSKSTKVDPTTCRVHRYSGSPEPTANLRSLGKPDHRIKPVLRRHCSMGYSPSHHRCTSPHSNHPACTSGNVSPDVSSSRKGSRSTSPCLLTSPDFTPSQPRPCTSQYSCSIIPSQSIKKDSRPTSPCTLVSPDIPSYSVQTRPCSSQHSCSSAQKIPSQRHRRQATPKSACSRSSFPPPERARSLSPSNPRSSSSRKTSLPSDSSS